MKINTFAIAAFLSMATEAVHAQKLRGRALLAYSDGDAYLPHMDDDYMPVTLGVGSGIRPGVGAFPTSDCDDINADPNECPPSSRAPTPGPMPEPTPFSAEIVPIHIPNTYCHYYEQGGDGDCSAGMSFDEAWQKCLDDGKDKCMGVMWNSCAGETSETSVNGAWKLMTAGLNMATCRDGSGHWDAFVRLDYHHIPDKYCGYYEQGGDGDCSAGISFDEAWQKCLNDGEEACMGIMWNSCTGATSDTSVNGAWKLMMTDQDASSCRDGSGHWDAFVRVD